MELDHDDVEVRMLARGGHGLATEGERAVALLTDLSDALRDEGWARDVCHAVQMRRRELDLDVPTGFASRSAQTPRCWAP